MKNKGQRDNRDPIETLAFDSLVGLAWGCLWTLDPDGRGFDFPQLHYSTAPRP
jgi:hypothetical protein